MLLVAFSRQIFLSDFFINSLKPSSTKLIRNFSCPIILQTVESTIINIKTLITRCNEIHFLDKISHESRKKMFFVGQGY